jgi:hypothetical protein
LSPRPSVTGGQQVPQQHDVAHLPDLRQRHAPVGVPREHPARDEPRRLGLAHEERRDGEVQLIHEARGEELGQDPGAALDHQSADPAAAKVGQDVGQLQLATRAAGQHIGALGSVSWGVRACGWQVIKRSF